MLFQIHRRIPLVRRPFWQRDRAMAERDSAVARCDRLEAERDEALSTLSATKEQRDHLNGLLQGLQRDRENCFPLPPGFASVRITGDQGRQFQVVIEMPNTPTYDQWIIDTKPYSEIARLLIQMLRGSGTLIDLGANIGTVSLPVAATGSHVVAVEMLPRNVMKLSLATAVNRLRHLRIIQVAATDHNGMVGYAGDEAWAQVSADHTPLQAVGLRLDTIIDLIEFDSPWLLRPPFVMKIDVEGHELAVLRGAERFLAKYRPAFIFESIQFADRAPGTARQVKEFVADLGYDLYLMRGSILAPHLARDLQIHVVSDILAIPREMRDAFPPLLTDYAMRPLSAEEQLVWLKETSVQKEWATHVAAVISQLTHDLPELEKDFALLLKAQLIGD